MPTVYYKDGYKYQLEADHKEYVGIQASRGGISTQWINLSESGWLTIRRGYAWDGPSGPTIDTPNSLRASLVHDALYQLMRLGLLSEEYREKADMNLYMLCVEDGMSPIRAQLWLAAVRMFAGICAERGSEKPVLTTPYGLPVGGVNVIA